MNNKKYLIKMVTC